MSNININLTAKKPSTSGFDANYNNQDKTLFIGKKDKSISVSDNNEIIDIVKQFSSLLSANGYIKIPTTTSELIIQWGKINVQADSSATGDFPISFQNSIFIIVGSHTDNDTITSVKIASISNTKYTATIIGGTGGENISWIAIGY